MTEVKELTESDLINSVVYFGAISWCAPCKVLHPMMENFSKKYPNLKFLYIDVDSASEVTKEHGIKGVPAVKLFINGVEKFFATGLRSRESYENVFRQYS